MKSYSRALAALALLLSLLLSAWLNKAQAEGRSLAPPSTTSVSSKASTSQAFRDLQANKNPFKKIGSSFRRIPPSNSNPRQNKCKPQLGD
ncbi:hypothetical protein Peur_020730 [Populus x canadensis]|uniref:Uncharacterized protein n=1 Tax=Populus trichocarpa TaxID=3694 RepID=A0A3N7FMH7_POPTR|nr:uncharacterized protein LOC133702068 [Populus nigra]KAI5594275.1 hypothetical protein BDE02_03G063100 [Populus trichocarpa]